MSTPQAIETARRIQLIMGTGYTAMGAWCLVHPSSVISLSLTPQYALISRTTCLLMRCFGAQAMTSGLLLSTATLNAQSFKIFGLSMVPYLAFNAWFAAEWLGFGAGREGGRGPMFTKVLLLDFVGNCVFMSGSFWAARLLGGSEKDEKKVE